MTCRKLLNCVHGLLVDSCADEEERDALEERLSANPAPASHASFEAMVRAAGGEVGK